MRNKIIPYHPQLKAYARQLRKKSTLPEVLLWQKIKQRAYGVQFHRQVPMLNYIVDFYCAEEQLVIELDGEVHNTVNAQEYDEKRTAVLTDLGIKVIRFENKMVFENLSSVLQEIKDSFKK